MKVKVCFFVNILNLSVKGSNKSKKPYWGQFEYEYNLKTVRSRKVKKATPIKTKKR